MAVWRPVRSRLAASVCDERARCGALSSNADLHQRVGLDPDAPPTWEALLATARAVARPEPQRRGLAIGTEPITRTAEQIRIAYRWQAGGEWQTPDGAGARREPGRGARR